MMSLIKFHSVLLYINHVIPEFISYILNLLEQNDKGGPIHKKTNLLTCAVDPSSILYFFGYKTEFLSFQNNPKNPDQFYKMALDLWDCLGRVKLVL